jgi:anti-sigma factor ChrR (cupin superfamily)
MRDASMAAPSTSGRRCGRVSAISRNGGRRHPGALCPGPTDSRTAQPWGMVMDLNANFDERVSVHAARMPWKASPMPGVERRMLDRLGDEVARATTIVRYAPDSHFSSHVHVGGEEFFVLDGVFQDEHGDFPAGSYIRNPPESRHTPGSARGCTIFVKLWQFDLADRTHVRINTNTMAFVSDPGRPGVEVMSLFRDASEDVRLERWAPGSTIALDEAGGLEILVLGGSFMERDEVFEEQSWLRIPSHGRTKVYTGEQGTRVWIKRGHLAKTPTWPR